jgi:glycosyltransferase involved in cell wall biosynthesis
MSITVSIIVPCFNDGRTIRQCVASIQKQTYVYYETIIVDDGSYDNETKKVLLEVGSWPNVTVYKQVNGGVASARNAGLKLAKGGYIVFLDADDYLEQNALEIMVRAAEIAKADLVGAGWRDVTDDGSQMRSTAPQRDSSDPYTNIIASFGLAIGGVLVKVRPELRFKDTMPWEALDYFLDYVSDGGEAVFVDDIVVNRRQGERPERLTNKLNHFEPLRMGKFFEGRKALLTQAGAATDERVAVLDQRILNCVQALLRQRRFRDAEGLAKEVRYHLLKGHPHYRVGSFLWAFRWGGFFGARFFVALNRLIGRA